MHSMVVFLDITKVGEFRWKNSDASRTQGVWQRICRMSSLFLICIPFPKICWSYHNMASLSTRNNLYLLILAFVLFKPTASLKLCLYLSGMHYLFLVIKWICDTAIKSTTLCTGIRFHAFSRICDRRNNWIMMRCKNSHCYHMLENIKDVV